MESTTENTLVAFHIGRGGRFYNAGHTTFIGENRKIVEFTDNLFVNYENYNEAHEAIKGRDNLEKLLEEATSDNVDAKDKFEKRTGIDLGNLIYVNHNGDPVGLDFENDGTGCINIDNDYDTTYVLRLKDCDEKELLLIHKYDGYVNFQVKQWVEETLVDMGVIFASED